MTSPAARLPIRVYRMALSGHCHRVELLLSLLALPYETVDVNLRAGEHKTPEFLARNAFGQIPVIEDDGVTIADSNAILVYLEARYAPGTWMPRDPLGAARVQRWLSVAAGPLASGPATARAIVLFGRAEDPALASMRARQLFSVMERELEAQPWLAGEAPTLADIASYAYVARAPEGGVPLDEYPAIQAWLTRVEGLPRFLPFALASTGKAA
jgi:glutathione S-transferase